MPNPQDGALMQGSDYAIMTFSALATAIASRRIKQPVDNVVMNVINALGISGAALFLKNLRRIEKEMSSQHPSLSCRL